MSASARNLALFNLAIESKLRASDLVRLKVEDVCSGRVVRDRGVVIQKKAGRPVQFEITEVTRQSVERLLASQPSADCYLFRSRTRWRAHIYARQYARIVHRWIGNIGFDDRGFGTHSLRGTKVAQPYRKTGNLRAFNRTMVIDLLRRLAATGVDFIKTEHLYLFDGQAGFSLGPGQ